MHFPLPEATRRKQRARRLPARGAGDHRPVRLINDLDLANYDAVFHIGDLSYANGFLAQWDQFHRADRAHRLQVQGAVHSGKARWILHSYCKILAVSEEESRSEAKLVCVARDACAAATARGRTTTRGDDSTVYTGNDSRGECGAPAENRGKLWYAADHGMFRFWVGDTEHNWWPGSEQHAFLERCFASADRKHQPWLVFAAHPPAGAGLLLLCPPTTSTPRRALMGLWQKHRVHLAFYVHVHNYERTYGPDTRAHAWTGRPRTTRALAATPAR